MQCQQNKYGGVLGIFKIFNHFCCILIGRPSRTQTGKCLSASVSVIICRRLSAVSKTADIMSLSGSFRYGKQVVPLTAHEGRPPTTIVVQLILNTSKWILCLKKITFLHLPTIHSLKTVLYILSFETFNDSMYSTNMVLLAVLRQHRCYIHSLQNPLGQKPTLKKKFKPFPRTLVQSLRRGVQFIICWVYAQSLKLKIWCFIKGLGLKLLPMVPRGGTVGLQMDFLPMPPCGVWVFRLTFSSFPPPSHLQLFVSLQVQKMLWGHVSLAVDAILFILSSSFSTPPTFGCKDNICGQCGVGGGSVGYCTVDSGSYAEYVLLFKGGGSSKKNTLQL